MLYFTGLAFIVVGDVSHSVAASAGVSESKSFF